MSDRETTDRPSELGPQADLATVLAAWNDATLRLTETHEALRGEVRRLTDELAVKNRELARRNRLADLGQMAAHVAHEVRNNLVPVTLYASLLRRRLSDDSGSLDVLRLIESGLAALDGMAGDLLHFTCDRDPQCRTMSIHELVTELVASLAPQLEAQGIEAIVDVPPNLVLDADAGMLRRALLNLTFNALDAMTDGGQLTITACRTHLGVELEVADTGPGLSDEVRQRAFEPFFTTKSDGTGLGLAIVYRIADAHGGDVQAANCPDGGAAFTLRLPTRRWEAAA